MTFAGVQIHIDTGGTLERARASIHAAPGKIDLAERRALRVMRTWVTRQVLQAASKETGITQKALRAAGRIKSTQMAHAITIWIGTNPIKAHHLGTVVWTPLLGPGSRHNRKPSRMAGARVGKRQFPGSWSWGEGSKTGPAIMHRTGIFGRLGKLNLERIDVVTVPVHEAMERRLNALRPEIPQRFDIEFRRQFNYALNLEGRN